MVLVLSRFLGSRQMLAASPWSDRWRALLLASRASRNCRWACAAAQDCKVSVLLRMLSLARERASRTSPPARRSLCHAHLLPSDGSPPLSRRPTSFLGRAFPRPGAPAKPVHLQCVQMTRFLAPKPLVEALVVCVCHARCEETVWQVADSTEAPRFWPGALVMQIPTDGPAGSVT